MAFGPLTSSFSVERDFSNCLKKSSLWGGQEYPHVMIERYATFFLHHTLHDSYQLLICLQHKNQRSLKTWTGISQWYLQNSLILRVFNCNMNEIQYSNEAHSRQMSRYAYDSLCPIFAILICACCHVAKPQSGERSKFHHLTN